MGGGAHVASNTEYLLEVGGPLGMPTTYYPYPSPCQLLPLLLPLPTTYILLLLPLSTTYIPLLLPLPTTTPTPPLTYYVYTPTPPLTYYVYTPTPPLTYYVYTPTPPLTYYVYTPTPPLTYYSPGAWSEVTSKVTYVMMTNSLIHYCQSMKHIYMDTVYKLS